MAEKLGIEKLQEVVKSACKVVNGVVAFLNHEGLLSLYPILVEAQGLVQVDWMNVKLEVLDLSAEEGEALKAVMVQELKLPAAAQVKVVDVLNLASDTAKLAVKVVSAVNDLKDVAGKAKAILGV